MFFRHSTNLNKRCKLRVSHPNFETNIALCVNELFPCKHNNTVVICFARRYKWSKHSFVLCIFTLLCITLPQNTATCAFTKKRYSGNNIMYHYCFDFVHNFFYNKDSFMRTSRTLQIYHSHQTNEDYYRHLKQLNIYDI